MRLLRAMPILYSSSMTCCNRRKNCYMTTIGPAIGKCTLRNLIETRPRLSRLLKFIDSLRMPFGLRNAPATFQRLIDRFRTGAALKDVTILGYIDDLIVISASFEQHLQDLGAVFDHLLCLLPWSQSCQVCIRTKPK